MMYPLSQELKCVEWSGSVQKDGLYVAVWCPHTESNRGSCHVIVIRVTRITLIGC
jgi:hypothetical protein